MSKAKTIIIAFFATLTSLLGNLAIPVYLLVGFNVVDYLTGILAAKNRGQQVSSYYGFIGIAKKVCMYLLVGVGVGVDVLLKYIIETLGLPLILPFIVGCVVAVWLVLNEIISILENLNDIGTPMPPFLMPLVKRIRGTVEEKGQELVDDIPDSEIVDLDSESED